MTEHGDETTETGQSSSGDGQLTRRRTLALAATGLVGGATGLASGAGDRPNAEVSERGDGFVAENYDRGEVVYGGPDFLAAIQAAVDSLTPGRESTERVLVSASGETGSHSWDGDVKAVDLPSYTALEVTGTINVTDTGDELIVPVRVEDAHHVAVPELNVTGNPRYGMKLESVRDISLGAIDMTLWESSDVGIGVRIDDAEGSRSRNVSIEWAHVEGAAGHGVETYGVDGLEVGVVTTVDTGGCGLLLNDTSDATVGRVDATRADPGGGYAGFRCANDAGPNVTLERLRAVDCGRGFFFVSGSHGVELRDVDVDGCGSCLIQDTRDTVVDGGSIRNSVGSGVRIDSRSSDRHHHTRNVTVRDLELIGNRYGVRETGPATANNAVLDNYLRDNDEAIETYADSTTVRGNVHAGGDGAPLSDGTYLITNAATGKVLDVTDGSTADGANVQQWAYWGGRHQHWRVSREADGTYRIENAATGKVLDVAGGRTGRGANVVQWRDHGGDNQRFDLVAGEGRTFRLRPVHSGTTLEVPPGTDDHGANVRQWSDWGGRNQRWTFEST